MGDQRRDDQDREEPARAPATPAPREPEREPEREDAAHDTTYAARQVERQQARAADDEWHAGSDLYPERQIAGVGDQDALWQRFMAAVQARQPEGLVALVQDMDAARRAQVAPELTSVAAFAPGRDVLVLGDLARVAPGEALRVALSATPPATIAEVRSHLGSVPPRQLLIAIGLPGVRAALDGLGVSATDVAPQVMDTEAFGYAELVRWYLDTTPAATVARAMIARGADDGLLRALNVLGRAGWLWAFHVDDALARMAGSTTLQAWAAATREADVADFLRAKDAGQVADGADTRPAVAALRDALDARPVDVAAALDALRTAEAAGREVLEARRAAFVAAATVAEIEQATYLVPTYTPSDQLDWMLDKPGVSADELRAVLTAWTRSTRGEIEARTLARLRRRLPDARPTEIFGVIPDGLHQLALDDVATRRWLADDATPLDLLRLATFAPDRTADLCRWLEARGDGYGWVYRLGGGAEDFLLRRFVLQCPDATVVRFVEERLLGDAIETEAPSDDAVAIDAMAYADGATRLGQVLDDRASSRVTAETATRVDELSDEDVMEVRGDRARLRAVLERTTARTLAGVLDRIQPPLREVLLHAPEAEPAALAAWARSRPADQVREAMAHHVASARAREWLGIGPLELFDALSDGAVLGQVLLRNPGILDWILKRGEPTSALVALGDPGAAAPAAAALAAHPGLLRKIPPGQMLPADARRGLAAIASHAPEDLRDELAEHLRLDEGDESRLSRAETQASTMTEARAASGLIAALDLALAEDNARDAVIVRLCRERATDAEVAAMVEERPDLLAKLQARTVLGPTSLLPRSALATVLRAPQGLAWALATMPAFELLRLSSRDAGVRARFAAGLDADEDELRRWLHGLPRGAALSDYEEAALDQLAATLTTATAARRAFAVRFGIEIDAAYDLAEVQRLWGVLVRVPDAHVEQMSVTWFEQFAGGGGAGAYYPESRHITLREGLDSPDQVETINTRRDDFAPMTREQAMAALGLDDAGVTAWIADGRLSEIGDGSLVRLTPRNAGRKYDATVLHEIGHAVDAMLGGQTELVFGLAGWRVYAESDFEAWATELGGWGQVTTEDRREIRRAWLLWLSQTRGDLAAEPIARTVGEDHPAVARRYAGVGVVDLAASGRSLDVGDPGLVAGRGALVSFKNQHFYTLSERGLRAAPTQYSLTAPAEYFAECYMTYYHESDGSTATAGKKGAHLATWIKQWLDDNVDAVDFNPQRDGA